MAARGRPKEFERRYPIYLTAEQNAAVREIREEYDTSYAEALRYLLNTGIIARNRRNEKTPR
jgi:predicted transcriptional regulator